MEDTLDGGPSVSDSNWSVVSISQQIINEFPGMWTRSASCLKNERDKIDVWVPVELGLLRSVGHKTWFCVAAATRDGLQENGATLWMRTEQKVTVGVARKR